MGEMKHTPGPWVIRRDRDGRPSQIDSECSDGFETVTRYSFLARPATPRAEANARLIASAPDLLKVAKEIQAEFGGVLATAEEHGFAVRLRAAIAKAEGEDR